MNARPFLSIARCSFLVVLFSFPAHAAPEHFTNPPENINPDPAYVPGDYLNAADPSAAVSAYQAEHDALLKPEPRPAGLRFAADKDGELRVTVTKNETAPVLAYFRDFAGYLSFQKDMFAGAGLVISVNSWDSGVPGRDLRITNIFFRSTALERASAKLELTKITEGPSDLPTLQNGKAHTVRTEGTLSFGGVSLPVAPAINIQWKERKWLVTQAEPLTLLISDLGLEPYVPELMKECNHQSIANRVSIEWQVTFA